jgi:sortase B
VKKNKAIYIIIIFLLAIAALCGFFFARAYTAAREEISEYEAVRSEYVTVHPVPSGDGDSGNHGELSESAESPYISADFDALLLANPDTVGWIAIPDSTINYPVVQASDNAKYLGLSFQGKYSGAGTPFADQGNDLRTLGANTIIYGHNMGAGRRDMFGSLLSYKEHEYYMAHRDIWFDTIYQRHGWWRIFAVIEHDTRLEDFSYPQLGFDDEVGFAAWIAKAKELSIYDSDTDIYENDHILTLSTCDRSIGYGRAGRLLILAVKTNERED